MDDLRFAEDRLVAALWVYGAIPERGGECTAAVGVIREGHFLTPGRGAMWRVLAAQYAAGKSMEAYDPELMQALADAAGKEAFDAVFAQADADRHGPLREPLTKIAAPVARAAKNRQQVVFVTGVAREMAERLERGDDPSAMLRWGEDQAAKWLQACQRAAVERHITPEEIIARELHALNATEYSGYSWPWPKFQRNVGMALRPGYFFGITGLAGAGKSTLLANLFVRLVLRGVPVIAAITEEAQEWLRRAWAAEAGVPQSVAEPQAWNADHTQVLFDLMHEWQVSADEVRRRLREYKPMYEAVLRAVDPRPADGRPGAPWAVIDDAELTIDALLAKTAAIRRQWRGRHVVLLADHAHNFVYPNNEPDRHIGEGCRRIKRFTEADDDGGLTTVSLFQPRKPPRNDPEAPYRAISAQDIAGRVAPHLTGHVSVYRQRVMPDPDGRITEWGTPRCATFAGHPQLAKVQSENDADSVDDDQHMWFFADKRRRAGRAAKAKFYLNMQGPTGQVYELDGVHAEPAMRGVAAST